MDFNRFFVKNWQFTFIIFIAVMVLGINALLNMPRAEDPPFDAPMFTVVVVYPGTSPQDMETLIADPIEEELYKLSDVKKINTTIKDGLVVMLAEFNFGVNVETKNNDVISEINKIRPDLPEGIILLDIKKAASSDVAILQTAIISDTASTVTMRKVAENLEQSIEKIKDVKWAEVQAMPEKSIKVDLDIERMQVLNLGLNQVLGLIQANNINIPGGSVDLGHRSFNIKTTSELKDIEDVKKIIVNMSPEGKTLSLGQIANIYYADNNESHIARYNGRRAMWVISAMKDKKNIIDVRKQIQAVLDDAVLGLPKGVTIANAFDQEVGVRSRLGGLGKDFLIAIFLVLLTLLPLGTRASIIVMISIPLSLSIGLFLLEMLGYTLNQLSIVGMVISLGLLVDDSIVVVENIERYMRKGISAREAAISATNHIMVAILGCTATLLLAFLPLANLPEGSGDFIRPLPMAVMLTVLASLFVSVTIIPFLSSIILKGHENASHSEGNLFFKAFRKYINSPYQRLLIWCVKHPVMTLSSAFLIFAASLLIVPILGFSLFPASEKPILNVEILTEPGSNLKHTDRTTHKVEQIIQNMPEIDHFTSNVGKGNPRIYYNEFQSQESSNLAHIVVHMDNEASVPEITAFAEKLRQRLANIPGADIVIKRFQQGPPISAPIELRVIGQNLDSLKRINREIELLMKNKQGSMYVGNSSKYEQADLVVNVDKDKAGLLGITAAEVAKTVRLAIVGIDISQLKDDQSEQFKLRIGLPENSINALETFDRVQVTSLSGALVPLKNIAQIEFRPKPSMISHFNKDRFSMVSTFLQKGYNVDKWTTEILEEVEEKVKLPKGYTIAAAGERESAQESFGGLGTIIILTVFGLLAILVLEFKTFKSTLIVLSVIPMGIIGALLALWFAGESMSFVATVGIIALIGIEIKNSILMVDYTNALRAQGMGLYDAVMDGAETRFLPILLTSMTAIGGLIPLLLEKSPLISPLAIVLIGGLISSTLLSRLVTPVLYYLIPPSVEVQDLSSDSSTVL
jgi:multidrug efflux pump subunit AcrB